MHILIHNGIIYMDMNALSCLYLLLFPLFVLFWSCVCVCVCVLFVCFLVCMRLRVFHNGVSLPTIVCTGERRHFDVYPPLSCGWGGGGGGGR